MAKWPPDGAANIQKSVPYEMATASEMLFGTSAVVHSGKFCGPCKHAELLAGAYEVLVDLLSNNKSSACHI